MTAAETLTLLALQAILVASTVSDLRHLRIPNTHVLLVIALFVVSAPLVLTWPEFASRILAAAIAFGIGFVLFALRLFGGGDVKMMAALLLLVPSAELVLFLRLFAVALLASSLAMLALQRLPAGQRPGWDSVRSAGHVPVGVSMALAVGLLLVFAEGPA